ncbi:hypothetical protein PIB30_032375 [Stylosanthes scabra]|uniref:Protein kinase domain-containing protein n=1 Tax=Stylosanthes scabra TaxID=79078 RepID=A0ABU6UEU6_9FABA|nr:hypothetical protein [Stylosanthes scabra]
MEHENMGEGEENFHYQELLKATDNFNPKTMIGKGSHGIVYKGLLPRNNNNNTVAVAVKKPSSLQESSLHRHDDNSNKLQNEIRVLSILRKSPHVLNLLGTSRDSFDNKVMVMELLPNGSLHDWLHGSRRPPPSWTKRVEIAMQISRAVQFLHEGKPTVIHRDIKSTNILFDSEMNAKLGDFGLAVMVGTVIESAVSQPAGTIGYIDPSYTSSAKLSPKNDIFSLGVVLLEIISGRKAIDVSKTPASLVEWAVPLLESKVVGVKEICDGRVALPAFMAGAVGEIVRLAGRCVSEKEEDRPCAREVVMRMEVVGECACARVMRFPFWRSVFMRMVGLRGNNNKRRKLLMNNSSKTSSMITFKQVLADVTFT